jgi:pilus assembly protein Flp/PilA
VPSREENWFVLLEGELMPRRIADLCSMLLAVLSKEDGQDLIEYALVVALIAFAAIGGMGSVATAINDAFITVGTTLTTNI